MSAAPSAGVALADVDGDTDLEIAVPLSDGTVELIHHDGTAFNAGWPFDTGTGSPVVGVSIAAIMHPAGPAVCFATVSGGVYAVHLTGSLLSGYPAAVAAGDVCDSEPIIARVARPEVERPQLLLSTLGGWLHEWTAQAQTPADWPNYYPFDPALSPVAADVDADGIQELVLAAGDEIYVLDTGTPELNSESRRWPMAGHDLARSGCAECAPRPPAWPAACTSFG